MASGTYDVGALNEQVWRDRSEAGEVDLDSVYEVWRTPAYFDYHWIAHPALDERLGPGATQNIVDTFISLDADNPEHAEILDLFGAKSFIPTDNANYAEIEAVGREIGSIR